MISYMSNVQYNSILAVLVSENKLVKETLNTKH